jgi:protein-S-isoprenylcysteine O-methyltransferase Ste14
VNQPVHPNTAPRLRFTLLYYCALAVAAGTTGRPHSLAALTDHIVECIALILVMSACLGRIWCSTFIGGYKSTTLITTGPYAICRHPLYVFSLLGAVGMGLATRSLMLTLLTASVFVVLLSHAARAEERYLAEAHPSAFSDYVRVTPRWWPRWSHYSVADVVTIRPAILRKAFFDAGAFVLLYLAIDSLRALREARILPTLFEIP